jgi:hypothetical protein
MSRAIGGFVVIAFVAGFALSSGCAGKTSAPGPNQSKPEISVDHILDSPQDFIGDRVRLSGDVAEPHGERMFTLQDDDAINKEQMLVVTRRPVSRLLGEERTTLNSRDEVLVTGVIRPGDLAAIEAELGLDIDSKLENRFRGKPVLLASEVVRTDERPSADVPDTLTPR